jgi:alcohol oxidase
MLKSNPPADQSSDIDFSKQLDDTADQTPKTVRARKLVVISAGALSTPQILERSGVGSASVLSPLGIPVVSDLPGVGINYQDHTFILAAVSHVKGGPDETGDFIIRQDSSTMSRLNEEYKSGKGALAWNFIDAGSKLSPSSEELTTMGEDFNKVWTDLFVPFPDKSLMFVGVLSA